MQILPSDEETLAVDFYVRHLQPLAHEVLRKHKSCSVQQLADAWTASRPQPAASPAAAVPARPHVAAGPDTPAIASCSGAPARAARRPAASERRTPPVVNLASPTRVAPRRAATAQERALADATEFRAGLKRVAPAPVLAAPAPAAAAAPPAGPGARAATVAAAAAVPAAPAGKKRRRELLFKTPTEACMVSRRANRAERTGDAEHRQYHLPVGCCSCHGIYTL